jgi:hypothetical protein
MSRAAPDTVGYLLGQKAGACLSEVDVARPLDGRQPGQGERVEIVHPHAVSLHDSQGGAVVPLDVAFDSTCRTIRNRRRGGKDEFGARLLKPLDDLFQVAGVLVNGHDLSALVGRDQGALGIDILEIVQAVIEMNHIPWRVPQPGVELGEAIAGMARVPGIVIDLRFAGEKLFVVRSSRSKWSRR